MAEKIVSKIDAVIDTLDRLVSQLQEIKGIVIGFGMSSETVQAGTKTTKSTETAPTSKVEEAPSKPKTVEMPEPPSEWKEKLQYEEVSEIFDNAIDELMATRNYAEVTTALTGLRDTIEESGILKTFHPAMYEVNSSIRKYKAMDGSVGKDEKESIANEIREWKVRFLK